MKNRALIMFCHTRNEDFRRDLWRLFELAGPAYLLVCLASLLISEGKDEEQEEARWRLTQLSVVLVKEVADRFRALVDKWPKAVWLFFPDSGIAGMYGVLRPFYTETIPLVFPTEPATVPWPGCYQVKGNMFCGAIQRNHQGAPQRIRQKEMKEALDMWDHFKEEDLSYTDLALKFFPSISYPGMTREAKLMAVLRRLRRIHPLIYGSDLPPRRERRLTAFDGERHVAECPQCDPDGEERCQVWWDYVNKDYVSLREELREIREGQGRRRKDRGLDHLLRASGPDAPDSDCGDG